MNRYKKELRKHGFQLEIDYPFIPYSVGSNPALDGVRVFVKVDHLEIAEYYVVGTVYRYIGRDLKEDYDKQVFD